MSIWKCKNCGNIQSIQYTSCCDNFESDEDFLTQNHTENMLEYAEQRLKEKSETIKLLINNGKELMRQNKEMRKLLINIIEDDYYDAIGPIQKWYDENYEE